MNKTKMVSLGELAIELKINKSKLSYYYTIGLINPIETIGKMNLFNKEKTLLLIEKVNDLRKSGKTISEIKKILRK